MHVKEAMLSPRRNGVLLVLVYLGCLSLTLAHHVYVAYDDYFLATQAGSPAHRAEQYALHNVKALSPDHPFFSGSDHAPDQYRIGVLLPVAAVSNMIGIRRYYITLTVVDLISCFAVCLVLCLLLCTSPFYAALEPEERKRAMLLLLAILPFPLFWVVPWERPETLPTALLLAGATALIGRIERVRSRSWLIAGALGLMLWQSFVRSDAAAVFGAALLIAAVLAPIGPVGSRKVRTLLGAGIFLVAIAVQLYLQKVLFPHATYPQDTPVVQLRGNLRSQHLFTFFSAVVPFAAFFMVGRPALRRMDFTDRVASIAALLYLPLFATVGVLSEVRACVPFLLLLTPLATKSLVGLTGEGFCETSSFNRKPG